MDHIIIWLKINLFSPWYSWQIAELFVVLSVWSIVYAMIFSISQPSINTIHSGHFSGLPRPIYFEVSIKSLGIILIVWWCLTPLSTIVQLYQWRSVLLVEETGVPGENQRLVTSNWQTRSHNVLHLALIEVRTHSISGWLHRYSCQLSSDHGYDGPAGGVGLFWGVGLSKLCYWRSNVISSINRYVPLMSSSSSSGTVSTSAVVECKCAAPSEI